MNTDRLKPHTIQSTNLQSQAYFGSTAISIPYGQSYSITFTKAGSYDYTTGPYQPQLAGTIFVS
jgi:plastocyanin